jgi:SAM-dependent methyltransferase
MRAHPLVSNLCSLPELTGLRGDLAPDQQFTINRPTSERYVQAVKWYLTLLKRDLIGGNKLVRDVRLVSAEYEAQWGLTNAQYAAYLDNFKSFVFVRGRPHFVNGWFLFKHYMDVIGDIIDRLRVTSVLEVGAGRGKNLAVLALRRPKLSLTGIELTDNGVASSHSLRDDLPPQFLKVAGVAAFSAEARASVERIDFHQGDATQMPFPDRSFDASFTSLVLEQLPRDYPKALKEMRRVTRKYCIFNEAFHEANNWRGRAYLKRVDFFNARYRDFEKYGLKPVFFTTALPQKMTFRSGCLVTRVMD